MCIETAFQSRWKMTGLSSAWNSPKTKQSVVHRVRDGSLDFLDFEGLEDHLVARLPHEALHLGTRPVIGGKDDTSCKGWRLVHYGLVNILACAAPHLHVGDDQVVRVG